MRIRLIRSVLLATILAGSMAGLASAHPNNTNTLHFELTCDDGHDWNASFNGGPAAFHLDGGRLFIWKQIDFVTPTGETGSVQNGMQGFSGAPTVVCMYTGAVSGNAYTVTGFYPNAR
jgi:hypothetical protein